jgi:hypothetical protein
MAGWNQKSRNQTISGVLMSLQKINLGEEGLEFVASSLRGELGLCAKLARQLERGGDVFAPLPEGTSRERALQFNAGGLMSGSETDAWFARELEQMSGRTEKGGVIFQDVWFTPQDRVRGGYDGVFFDQSCVYFVLGPGEINAAAISRTIRRLHSFKLVAVFSNFNFRAADLPPTHVVADTLVDEIAHGAQEVFLGAYDQEGLVVWRSKD